MLWRIFEHDGRVFRSNGGGKASPTSLFQFPFNSHIIMARSDIEPGLSEGPTTFANPFAIAAGSVAFSKPARLTRGVQGRKPVVPVNSPKASAKTTNRRTSPSKGLDVSGMKLCKQSTVRPDAKPSN